MSSMDEVFGRRSNRPDHPDFWRISEVILAADGAIEAATSEGAKAKEWKARTSAVVDIDSVQYAAMERAKLAFGIPGGGSAFGRTGGRVAGLTIEQQATVAALWIEAFVYGAMYEQRGGHQDKN